MRFWVFTSTVLLTSLISWPVFANDAMREAAEKFIPTLKSECDVLLEDAKQPDFYSYSEKSSYNAKVSQWMLVRVPCNSGAYNFDDVWLVVDKDNVVKRAVFAVPTFETEFEENGEYDKVKSIRVSGYSVQNSLTNSSFDPSSGRMKHFPKGRGIADIYDSGVWRFSYGDFILEIYEQDPTADGKMSPAIKLDFTK